MRNFALAAAAVVSLAAGAASAQPVSAAQGPLTVSTAPQAFNALYTPGAEPLLEPVQYLWGGRNYCWYDGGWHGPGWYWCGYAFRRGFGWGGGFGWHGWARGGHGFHGGHGGGFHGGGFHGGGHEGGFHGGGHEGGGHEGGGHGGGGGHHH